MSERLGLNCELPALKHDSPYFVQTLKENSFSVRGPQTYNSLPAYLKNFTGSLESFKKKLDKFLATVPDKPVMPNYPQSISSNCLVQHIRARESTAIYDE